MKTVAAVFALQTGLVAGRISSLHNHGPMFEDKNAKTSYCDDPVAKAQGITLNSTNCS